MCIRLASIRTKLGFTQADFCWQVGIQRAVYSNYESFRTPLPCDIALRFCHQFLISEKWLATGGGLPRPCAGLYFDKVFLSADFRGVFADVFNDSMGKRFDEIMEEPFYLWFERLRQTTCNPDFSHNLLDYIKECVFGCLPSTIAIRGMEEMLQKSMECANKILLNNERDPRKFSAWNADSTENISWLKM